jgi:translation initiation factor RLI1
VVLIYPKSKNKAVFLQIRIDYSKCQPQKCSKNGECQAIKACQHKVLRQEEKFDPPFFHPSKYCHECGLCAKECPFSAIELK